MSFLAVRAQRAFALFVVVHCVLAIPVDHDQALGDLAIRELATHPFADPSAVQLGWTSDAQLTAQPSVLPTSGAIVTVSWSFQQLQGVQADFEQPLYIVQYLEGEDVQKVAPIKYLEVDGTAGSVPLQVVNMRKAAVFYLCKGPLQSLTTLSRSNLVAFKRPLEPTGGRLALTSTPGEIQISWNTGDVADQRVQYGKSSGSYSKEAIADHIVTYTREDLCGAPATTIGFRDPGKFFTVHVKGLAPNETVFYRFGSDETGWSQEFAMRTPPSDDQDHFNAVKILLVGDMGTHSLDESTQHWSCPPSRNTTDAMLSEVSGGLINAGMVLHVGDLSYAVGYGAVWDQFHEQIAPISSQIPWMVAVGNHERDWLGTGSKGLVDSGGECGVPTELRFRMPWNQQVNDKPWYSFNYGPVHFSILSSEHNFEGQYPWLKADFEKVDRSKTPWLVVALHRPVYIDSVNYMPIDGDQTIAKQLRSVFEDLFFENKVDMVFTGHHHSYQRSCPVYKEKCIEGEVGEYAAPIYIITGNGGFFLTPTVEPRQPKIFKVVDIRHHGFSRVTADMTSFTLEYVRGDDRHVHDTVILKKGSS